jgi:hypothetical protein
VYIVLLQSFDREPNWQVLKTLARLEESYEKVAGVDGTALYGCSWQEQLYSCIVPEHCIAAPARQVVEGEQAGEEL